MIPGIRHRALEVYYYYYYYYLRPRAHNRSLPATDNIMRKNFVMRMLYKDSFWFTCYYLFLFFVFFSYFYISTPKLSLITWIFCLLLYSPDVVYFIAYNHAIITLYVHHLRLTNVIKVITYILTYLPPLTKRRRFEILRIKIGSAV